MALRTGAKINLSVSILLYLSCRSSQLRRVIDISIILEVMRGVGMIFNAISGKFYRSGLVVIGILLLALSTAHSADPASTKETGDWNKVLEAAKKEGKLVMSGDPSEEWRKSLVDMFMQEYPAIKIEYLGMNGRDFSPRIRRERELGQKLWDLLSGGTSTALDVKKEGITVPIRPLLLPEIADDSRWIGGLNSLFSDKENRFIPTYTMFVQKTSSVNRDFIKESDIKSSSQLLDPKFKGKIVMQNPTAGASFSALCNLGFMYGEQFVRDLLSKQDLIATDDKRQQAEWVVRGKYPITIGFNETQLIPFVKQGLGKNVLFLDDKIIPLSTSLGSISLFKDAPHPNAAKVYINWLLSRNTQMKLCKNVRLNSRRTDVPVVVKESAVDTAHLSNYFDYSTEDNLDIRMRFQPIIKESFRK